MSSQRRYQQTIPVRDRDELLAFLTGFKSDLVVAGPADEPARSGPAGLTARETEVLRLVALGRNNSEIAQKLFISVNTVTRHMTNVFTKTGTANRVEAAVYAIRHRIL